MDLELPSVMYCTCVSFGHHGYSLMCIDGDKLEKAVKNDQVSMARIDDMVLRYASTFIIWSLADN